MAETKLTVNNHGPLRITGDFVIYDAEGQIFGLGGRNTVSLCRCGYSAWCACGNSKSQPFCDGSHRKAGFQSEIQARQLPPPAVKP